MALHLCLLIGQFVILHLKTKIEDKVSISGISIASITQSHLTTWQWCMENIKKTLLSVFILAKINTQILAVTFTIHPRVNVDFVTLRDILCNHYLWYWACRNWNSSLILSQDSATVNLKPGWPGWCGAWKKVLKKSHQSCHSTAESFLHHFLHCVPWFWWELESSHIILLSR